MAEAAAFHSSGLPVLQSDYMTISPMGSPENIVGCMVAAADQEQGKVYVFTIPRENMIDEQSVGNAAIAHYLSLARASEATSRNLHIYLTPTFISSRDNLCAAIESFDIIPESGHQNIFRCAQAESVCSALLQVSIESGISSRQFQIVMRDLVQRKSLGTALSACDPVQAPQAAPPASVAATTFPNLLPDPPLWPQAAPPASVAEAHGKATVAASDRPPPLPF